jgi:NAD(P)-dependent dehydrogenase (short-subunit alcohol dehydrogenase family)
MSHHSEDLSGKTIVIAGASSGFGRGAALELATRGAKTPLRDHRSEIRAI